MYQVCQELYILSLNLCSAILQPLIPDTITKAKDCFKCSWRTTLPTLVHLVGADLGCQVPHILPGSHINSRSQRFAVFEFFTFSHAAIWKWQGGNDLRGYSQPMGAGIRGNAPVSPCCDVIVLYRSSGASQHN